MTHRRTEREPLLKFSIPETWQTTQGLALRGWILTENGPPDTLEIWLGNECIPIASWHARPDIIAKHPQFNSGEKCGFWAYLPISAQHRVHIKARTAGRVVEKSVDVTAPSTRALSSTDSAPHLFERFRIEVNERQLSVLEIGSRIVCPDGASKRNLFPAARSYTRFDHYHDNNTDVVGDARTRLSSFQNRFDAVFSLDLLEHLAMPWLASMEINKVLSLGGLTFHQTHFTFPIHEHPWDFWRFSDQGLRVLFSRPLGWEVLGCEFTTPVRIYPDEGSPDLLHLPGQTGFIHVAVLARKVTDVDPSRFRWDASLIDILGVASKYPQSSNSSDHIAITEGASGSL
jgi:hypothetical protein